MSLVLQTPWDLFAEFNDSFARQRHCKESGWGLAAQSNMVVRPSIDINETDTAFHISAELPGYKKDNVKIQHKDSTLIISGEIKDDHVAEEMSEDKSDKRKWTRVVKERRFGSFQRSFDLGKRVDFNTIQAKFDNGVLQIEVAKKAADHGWKAISIA